MSKEELEIMMEEDWKRVNKRYADKFKSQVDARQKRRMKKTKKISEED